MSVKMRKPIEVAVWLLGCWMTVEGQVTYEQLSRSNKPPPGSVAPLALAKPTTQPLTDPVPFIHEEPPSRQVNTSPATLTPQGYPQIQPLNGRATVPGNTKEECAAHLRAFFLEKYPAFRQDPAGLAALVQALAEPAADFRGQLDTFLFNAAAGAYSQYAQIAALLDGANLGAEVRLSWKKFYAEALILRGDRRFSASSVARLLPLLPTPAESVLLPNDRSLLDLLQQRWPGFSGLSGAEKVFVLDTLASYNPWLWKELDKPLAKRAGHRADMAEHPSAGNAVIRPEPGFSGSYREENVQARRQTEVLVAGMAAVIYEKEGALYTAYYQSQPGEWLLLPVELP